LGSSGHTTYLFFTHFVPELPDVSIYDPDGRSIHRPAEVAKRIAEAGRMQNADCRLQNAGHGHGEILRCAQNDKRRAGTPLPSHPVTQSPSHPVTQSTPSAHLDSCTLRKITQCPFAPGSGLRVSRRPNARKCYGRMSIHMRTKHAKNDTKAIQKRSKAIRFQTKTSKTSTVSSCLV